MARGKSAGTKGRTGFNLPVRGRGKGNGMGGHKKPHGVKKFHRVKNRGKTR
jgi:hypothetical protein